MFLIQTAQWLLQFSVEDQHGKLDPLSKIALPQVFPPLPRFPLFYGTKLVNRIALTRSLWLRLSKQTAARQACYESLCSLILIDSCRSLVPYLYLYGTFASGRLRVKASRYVQCEFEIKVEFVSVNIAEVRWL